jgi:membrane-associated phospholipid phosphatase
VLGASLWCLGYLAEGVATKDPFVATDRKVAVRLHEWGSPELTSAFEAVTILGNVPVLAGVALAAGALLARGRRPYDAVLVLLAFAGAEVLSAALKQGFERDRPTFAEPRATETTFSFPSGHATVSLAVYGALAYVAFRMLSSAGARAAALAAATALVLLIGFSRLYLGVHYLSDVLAGFSAGLAWLALCVLALHLHRERESFRRERRPWAQTSR